MPAFGLDAADDEITVPSAAYTVNCGSSKLTPAVHTVPTEVEEFVARHKLESMGIKIDELTSQQRKYMSGWEQGT